MSIGRSVIVNFTLLALANLVLCQTSALHQEPTQIEVSVEVTEQINKMWRDIIPRADIFLPKVCDFFFRRLLALCFAELLNTVSK